MVAVPDGIRDPERSPRHCADIAEIAEPREEPAPPTRLCASIEKALRARSSHEGL